MCNNVTAKPVPTFAQALAACAGIATQTAQNDYDSDIWHSHFDIVYAYINAPGHINVQAPSAAESVAHLPPLHPVRVVLCVHHVAQGFSPCSHREMVESWYESDN